MGTRQQRRGAEQKKQKIEGRPRVYLLIPDEFLDLTDQPWTALRGNNASQNMDLLEVLMFTIRNCPVKTGGDAMRTLDCFQALKDTPDGMIEIARDDWDWMLDHFKEFAQTVWKAPDAAYLIRWLEQNVQLSPPEVSA